MKTAYFDMDGNEVVVGDILESPGRSSDPITITAKELFIKWPEGTPMVFARTGNWDGEGGVTCPLSWCLVLKKGCLVKPTDISQKQFCYQG